eukprot:CAMPEP_0181108712 /NCGR_PEP_ID=MMETSP1071-20121207/17780_1 /TAXON_ID=35127 /ORGANISM="Thalassiosira sp., Strain NH16" /LENGTH=323 /DNA_ID=CAMNT_0023192341 /DNA_START=409 /DNA_END=1380 /DNA_ORIENTATION=-
MESKLLETTLASVGCTSPEDREKVLIAREGEWRNMLSKQQTHGRMVMMHNASIVGEKIVTVAQSYVKDKLMDAVKDATDRMPPEVLENERLLYDALEMNEEVDLWTKARRSMEGPWRFILIPSPIPNAFVSEILPHRIFMTTALFEAFVESQDELALVLGHEISHLILGHSSARNSLETSFRTIEILLLSLDPSEGLLSLAFMSFLASCRSAIGAVQSRENERSADELGIKLTAMACYDTQAASHVFYKMHKHNVESGMESSKKVGWSGLSSLFDSHPPSEERFRALLEESREENREKYSETSCASLKKIFLNAIKPSSDGGN